ncbi:hypothetical protein [Leptospira langatensis]|nr:hypothetical protein [Leptospira langatensis]
MKKVVEIIYLMEEPLVLSGKKILKAVKYDKYWHIYYAILDL